MFPTSYPQVDKEGAGYAQEAVLGLCPSAWAPLTSFGIITYISNIGIDTPHFPSIAPAGFKKARRISTAFSTPRFVEASFCKPIQEKRLDRLRAA